MSSERIRIDGEYYLLASALAPRRPRLLLNHADSFVIVDLAGDIPMAGQDAFGLFCAGTRFLERFELRVNSVFPILLSSHVTDDGSELVTYLSNADEKRNDELVLRRDTVSICRAKTLFASSLAETLRLRNYGQAHLRLTLTVLFAADFADIFELRGIERTERGALEMPVVQGNTVRLRYTGLDNAVRETEIVFSPRRWQVSTDRATMAFDLAPDEETTAEIQVRCAIGDTVPAQLSYAAAASAIREERHGWHDRFPRLHSDNQPFNDWLNRSLHDLILLRAHGAWGPYVYAGVPWFATVFGRDGLITALETLVFAPELAADVLRTLASVQGVRFNADRDEEPGKIVHELRMGEMAAVGEVPFARYYGSVDATPLFVVLLAAYTERTADLELARELWPAAAAALRWIDTAQRDGDGYIKYARRSARGLANQGWKDSHDAISHEDGTLADPPTALAEVQAYAYAAYRGMAQLARRIGDAHDAPIWEANAQRLRERFDRDYWLPGEDTYALALDRNERPCRVVASNAAHCLFAGIADVEKGQRVIERMLRPDMFCGWGLRTLSARARRYNPMSYHNGSIWPHDNALAAAGFARYGSTSGAGKLLSALFDASLAIEDRRLPELFCGFDRHVQEHPVPYPVACKPQAWAAGSVFLMLQSVLGLSIDAWANRVTLEHAALPGWLQRLEIHGLRVPDGRVDLRIVRGARSAAVEVIDKEGAVEVVVRK